MDFYYEVIDEFVKDHDVFIMTSEDISDLGWKIKMKKDIFESNYLIAYEDLRASRDPYNMLKNILFGMLHDIEKYEKEFVRKNNMLYNERDGLGDELQGDTT